MSVKVTRTSVFPESAEKVFARLQKLSMLQMIASLWVSFTPSQAEQSIQWKKGAEIQFTDKDGTVCYCGVDTDPCGIVLSVWGGDRIQSMVISPSCHRISVVGLP